MKVIVPFTEVAPETRTALEGFAVDYVDVSGSLTDYWDLLAELWTTAVDFCVVEQDIVINPDTIPSFVRCTKPWCAAPYPYLGSKTYAGLGCVRFRRDLMQRHSKLMDRVALHKYDGHELKHWCVMDAAMQRELWKRNHHVCVAHAPVGHLSTGVSHGCVPA